MRRALRYRPSPALVLAGVALAVALGGTSYAAITLPANSVGAKQIKDSAVTSSEVKNRSLLAVDFKSGQLPRGPAGPMGSAGPPGATGATGATGPPGPTGPTNIKVRTAEHYIPSLLSGWVSISCAPGERATGGGGRATPGVLVYETVPANAAGAALLEGQTPVGWRVGFQNYNDQSATVTVYALCASP